MPANLYSQDVKRLARRRLLGHAVERLTGHRRQLPLVSPVLLKELLQEAETRSRIIGYDLAHALHRTVENWMPLYERTTRPCKEVSDLTVLFLCGPTPQNDLEVLLDLGVHPANVWAIESDRGNYLAAVESLKKVDFTLKIHHGSLREFFEFVPQHFDVVYFDACGPLLGGTPNTLSVIQELFIHGRLSPLSALVTNFAEAPGGREQREIWAKRLFCWNAARLVDVGGFEEEPNHKIYREEDYIDHIGRNLEDYYSEFISQFITELAGILMPWWRASAFPALRRIYVSSDHRKVKDAIKDMDRINRKRAKASRERQSEIGEASGFAAWLDGADIARLSPNDFHYLWCAKLVKEKLDKNDPLRMLYYETKISSMTLAEAILGYSYIRNFERGELPGYMENTRNLCSDALLDLLQSFRWLEEGTGMKIFCDIAFPKLIVDLLVGLYGFPYHLNLEHSLRLTYKARSTRMYSDVFMFDSARYLYDSAPSISLFDLLGSSEPYHAAHQLLLRGCMDIIGAKSYPIWGYPDLFRGSALVGYNELNRGIVDVPTRERLS